MAFYTQKLGLPLRKKGESLSILEFGGSYLMIEKGGVASSGEKTRAQNPTVLRLNVHDFEQTVQELREREVHVEVIKFDWGTIGVIIDPEGNRIEIKD
ncbi:hypothetical protein GCM10010965_22590 [Caldalkalibacillus thermarum]|uniref:VOC family protein n=1 Tax=Caldalkalibacillus thermarum TaxID=296745 RepID=UPI001665DA5D|nr:VOC family protein [Caldalkalibacillus thermarum]GGK29204.1 hypothetical protein GCM10010965_22590 [Caldalkalibacillus thermarum]